MMQKRSK